MDWLHKLALVGNAALLVFFLFLVADDDLPSGPDEFLVLVMFVGVPVLSLVAVWHGGWRGVRKLENQLKVAELEKKLADVE